VSAVVDPPENIDAAQIHVLETAVVGIASVARHPNRILLALLQSGSFPAELSMHPDK
jgi:hypothetical protein